MSYPLMPMVGVPPSVAKQLTSYREVFCREAGFNHISRYISGLVLSPNKTLQGIYAQQVWAAAEAVSRRAMHEAVFEAGWDIEALMLKHRSIVARDHRGRGREVIGLDWTLTHHERGGEIFGVKRSYDYVEHRMSYQRSVPEELFPRTPSLPMRDYGCGLQPGVDRRFSRSGADSKLASAGESLFADECPTELQRDGTGDATLNRVSCLSNQSPSLP